MWRYTSEPSTKSRLEYNVLSKRFSHVKFKVSRIVRASKFWYLKDRTLFKHHRRHLSYYLQTDEDWCLGNRRLEISEKAFLSIDTRLKPLLNRDLDQDVILNEDIVLHLDLEDLLKLPIIVVKDILKPETAREIAMAKGFKMDEILGTIAASHKRNSISKDEHLNEILTWCHRSWLRRSDDLLFFMRDLSLRGDHEIRENLSTEENFFQWLGSKFEKADHPLDRSSEKLKGENFSLQSWVRFYLSLKSDGGTNPRMSRRRSLSSMKTQVRLNINDQFMKIVKLQRDFWCQDLRLKLACYKHDLLIQEFFYESDWERSGLLSDLVFPEINIENMLFKIILDGWKTGFYCQNQLKKSPKEIQEALILSNENLDETKLGGIRLIKDLNASILAYNDRIERELGPDSFLFLTFSEDIDTWLDDCSKIIDKLIPFKNKD